MWKHLRHLYFEGACGSLGGVGCPALPPNGGGDEEEKKLRKAVCGRVCGSLRFRYVLRQMMWQNVTTEPCLSP